MRCPDCNKFVSFDTDQPPEINSLEVGDDGRITGEVRVVLPCADCSTELKEATLSIDFLNEAFDHECDEEGELSIEAEAEPDMKTEGSGRYMKTFYGVSLKCDVTCSCGEFDQEVTVTEYCQASGMEELV